MRGISIAIFVLCMSVVITFLGSVGLNQAVGVGVNPGLNDEAQRVNSSLGGPQDMGSAGGGGSFLGFAVYAIRTLTVFFALYTGIAPALITFGVPASLAAGIQMIVIVIGGLMIVQFGRGLVAE